MYIVKDEITYDEFLVLDESDNPVTGLIGGDFSTKLYDPDKNEVSNISAGVPIIFEELGDGIYRISFTPNKVGSWILIVYNSLYFPYGKGANYQCGQYNVQNMIKRILGLSQENYRIFNPKYDRNNNLIEGTIKTYPSAVDCENDTNTLAEYKITAQYNKMRMAKYKVVKL